MALQRLAGNRAVAALMGQRDRATTGYTRPVVSTVPVAVQLLTKVAEFTKRVRPSTDQQVEVDAIRGRLADYHAIKPKVDPTSQARLLALRRLDAAIHGWFARHVAGAIADTENGTFMTAVLASSEEEHRRLVAAITKDPRLLPVDTTDMGKAEQQQLLDLWRSIVTGTGNLTIQSRLFKGAFTDRMLAGLAKLLQTPAGRELVGQLNAVQSDPGKRIEIGQDFTKQLKALGRTDPADSQAVPKTVEGDVSSMAYSTESKDLPKDAKVADYTGKAEPAAFHAFVSALPKGTTHFRYRSTLYKLGTGIGSYVKMAGKGELHANIGTRGQEVLVPEFITLGHELGHSLRMMKGTTVPFVEDIEKFGFAGSVSDKRLWNNAEEYVNIKGVENQLRQEHGMEERVFHAGDRLKTQGPIIREKIETLLKNSELAAKHPTEYEPLFALFGKLMLLPDEDAKLRMLLSPGVQSAVRSLEGVAVGGEESSSSSSSGQQGGEPRGPEGAGEEGGDREGSAYEILLRESQLRADVPIDLPGLGGGDGGKAVTSSSAPEMRSTRQVMEEEDYEGARQDLRRWLRRKGIGVVPNGGGGRNNCLIISLLQVASGSRAEPDAERVRGYKGLLDERGVGPDDELLPTDPNFVVLLRAINRDYRRDMKVAYVQAFKGLDPPFALLESTIGTEPVAIWDEIGHFEALF